jgi:hypothetical protein
MNKELINSLMWKAGAKFEMMNWVHYDDFDYEKFAQLIIKECIEEIETYRIPVGNSAAGEIACEWTYDALKDIRQNIKDRFGISSE